MPRNENYIIQLQLEIQKLQFENHELKLENAILDTALLNACQSITRTLNFKEGEDKKLKQLFINRVKENYEYAEENSDEK